MTMADLQETADRLAIRELLDRYTIEVTRRNWDAVAACFHEDGAWVTSVGHDARGRAAVKETIRGAVEPMEVLVQMNHAIDVAELNGDRATTRSVLNEYGRAPGGVGGVFVLGVYTDTVTKVNGRWGFARRFFQVHFIDTSAPPGTVMVDYKNPATLP
jgi:ketosteroid isomerase-like protein